MRIRNIARLTTLFARLAAAPREAPHPRVEERLDERAPRGTRLDLYADRGGPPEATFVAVHGMTIRGARDHRLVHFARCLARSGIACAVPTLDGLAGGLHDPADIDRLADAIEAAAGSAQGRVGLVGFSTGASYALVAAARPDVAPRVSFVLSFGAYHDLESCYRSFEATRIDEAKDDQVWDDLYYLHLLLAFQGGDALGLSGGERAEIEDHLGRACSGSTIAEKRAFFDRRLRALDLTARARSLLDPEVGRRLSPAGKLGGLRCPVSLIHDEADTLVPSEQSVRIDEELRVSAPDLRRRLLVTGLLSHVDLRRLRLGELSRLYAALEPVFESAGR
jgi:acetyl esterase/lipase